MWEENLQRVHDMCSLSNPKALTILSTCLLVLDWGEVREIPRAGSNLLTQRFTNSGSKPTSARERRVTQTIHRENRKICCQTRLISEIALFFNPRNRHINHRSIA